MSPIRRELLNGLFVLVLASLISAAFEAFHVNFNVQLWVLIVTGIAIAVGGYVVFELTLSAEAREKASKESTRLREEEWLKRVGNPARLELGLGGGTTSTTVTAIEALKTLRPGSDFTIMIYLGPEGGGAIGEGYLEQVFQTIMKDLKRGTIREYKRLLCFEHNVFANDHEMKLGILRVGEGPGTLSRHMGEHCRWMMATKGCSLYVAPVILRHLVALFGTDKVSMTIETADPDTGLRTIAGALTFYDPPNGEIIEQFRQIERATERHMVAVHKIRFPEDAVPKSEPATR